MAQQSSLMPHLQDAERQISALAVTEYAKYKRFEKILKLIEAEMNPETSASIPTKPDPNAALVIKASRRARRPVA